MGLCVPISWLNDYVATSNTVELAERLTLAGLEIEAIDTIGQGWEENLFFVGEVVDVSPHPNADRLSLAKVEYGQENPIVVVCGAPNLRCYENNLPSRPLKVALALTGAEVIDAYTEGNPKKKLKPSSIRGIQSEGMICSEKEIGISDDHEGVLIFPEDAPTGASLKSFLGDEILNFDIKGGFSHLLSIYGIAREVSALTNTSGTPAALNNENTKILNNHSHTVTAQPPFVNLEIENPEYCSRYSALLIENVTIGPSPFWMQQRLLRAGMRPINNIVDITNYVMLELGQPLHAFDYDLLKERANSDIPTITVRLAKDQEKMVTLDGNEQTFDDQMLLITDSKSAIAIAGVMGGTETEVSDSTKNILLESANFEFLNNRRTSQILKFRTEASERFGKKIDPEATLNAALRAALLIVDSGGGSINNVFGDLYPQKKKPVSLDLNPKDIYRILGVELTNQEIIDILKTLEFKVDDGGPSSGNSLKVTVPSHRMDINISADLIEEIARVYGYNNMPMTLMEDPIPSYHVKSQRGDTLLQGTEVTRDILVDLGLDEIISYSIIDIHKEAYTQRKDSVDHSQFVGLRNPLSAERTHMRRSLLPGVLATAHRNSHHHDRIAIFEIGNVFHPKPNQLLPDEPRRLSLLMIGNRDSGSWMNKNVAEKVDFYDLKGVVEGLLEGLYINHAIWQKGENPTYHPGRCAEIMVNGQSIGLMGEIHPKVGQSFEMAEQSIFAAEFDLDILLSYWIQKNTMSELSSYEPIYEDLAFVVEESLSANQVESLILKTGAPLLKKAHLFDVFRGERVGGNMKSLAYALTYQAPDRTLTDKVIEPIRKKIIKKLKQGLNAELRS